MAKNQPTRRRPPSAVPWVIGALAVVAVVYVLVIVKGPAPRSHPEPRSDAASMGESLMPASFFAANPRIQRTYQLAREIPGTLDGLYCYCDCSQHAGHRSLLTCFQSEHGAGCDICLGEADTAHEMLAQKKSLAEIRAQIDLAFGRK